MQYKWVLTGEMIIHRVWQFSQMCAPLLHEQFCLALFVCVQQESGNNAEDDSLSDRPEHAQLWWV